MVVGVFLFSFTLQLCYGYEEKANKGKKATGLLLAVLMYVGINIKS